MAVLKYKLNDGWKLLYSEFFQKVVAICKQALLRNKNLSDLDDIAAARQNLDLDTHYLRRDNNLSDVHDVAEARTNLELVNEVTTHWHDTRYPQFDYLADNYVNKAGDTMSGALNLANNTWNKSGDDANVGDHNVAGKFCIQGQNGETGLALYANGSNSNYGTLSYDGTKFTLNKPLNVNGNEVVSGTFKTEGGFLPDIVDTPQLNDYHQKLNFIYGSHPAGANNHLSPFFGDDGCDYGGIVFGYPLNKAQDSWGGAIAQLIFNGGSRLLFRGRDSYTGENWGAWQSLANMNDINSVNSAISSLRTSVNGSISTLNSAISGAAKIPYKSISANGYIEFDTGLMIQWGKKLFNSNTVNNFINFNEPFSAVYTVVANGQRSTTGNIGGSYTYHMLSGQLTNTGFSIKSNIESGSGSQYIHWIAIGKSIDPSLRGTTVKVSFSRSGTYDYTITYTNILSQSISERNATSVDVKKGTTIKIKNNKNNEQYWNSSDEEYQTKKYPLEVKQGSTKKADIAGGSTWTSAAISAATTFTLTGKSQIV